MKRYFSQHLLFTSRSVNFIWRILGVMLLSLTLLLTVVGQAFAQDGATDPGFNIGVGINDNVLATAIQSDGKIIIGGAFTNYNGVSINRIARLNSNGSLDTTFNVGTGVDLSVRSIALQSDGKILVGGAFSTYNGASAPRIVRLNSDGSRDTSFVPASSGIDSTSKLAVQSDGKILHSGSYYSSSNFYYKIVRLNSDGSLDSSFTSYVATSPLSQISVGLTLALQSDGKIIVSCGNPSPCMVRLNSNGSLDANFSANLDGRLYSIVVQADGKILIGGLFTTYGGVSRNGLARLNPNGSLDTTFNVGTGASGPVYSVILQPDGKILICGLGSYNGTTVGGLARINLDGSLDTSFVSNNTNPLNLIALQSDNKILIFSNSTTADKRIARLYNTPPSTTALTSNLNPSNEGDYVVFTATVSPSAATGTVTFTFNIEGVSTNVTANVVNGTATFQTRKLAAGNNPVTATYNGSIYYMGSTSPVYIQTVGYICMPEFC